MEQALYYSRSNSVEKDFIIKEVTLQSMVSASLRRYSRLFIANGVTVELENLEQTVFTDPKWMDFILGQILTNAVKYRSSSPRICIRAVSNPNSAILQIQDNGIGMPVQDVSRVFDKGFTGENGRKFGKSTGIGLYLCKKLCMKLGLSISLRSLPGQGTTVEIYFPKSNMYR